MAEKKESRTSRPRGGLGSGLGDILGISYGFEEPVEPSKVSTIRLSRIEPNRNQPRKLFDDESIAALAESIRQNGVITPIALRSLGNDRYMIIAGERRWRAAKLADLTEIPAIVLDADDEKSAVMALTENLQREDLNPIDEAEGIRALIESFSLTQEECADRIGRSRPAVANALRLLVLEEEILTMLRTGVLSAGHGRALLAHPAGDDRIVLAKAALDGGWSVRRLEEEVKKAQKEPVPEPTPAFNYAAELSSRLTRDFGRGVKVVAGKKKGKLELEYYGNEDLDELLAKLQEVLKK
ncbi:MAG: ParB/RepB/Spo0J family partition protein [Ruminococcaceae bacterium]|nr:ParB/RepB/Spo0J family partition protein [Oscillospiraceae bacterium]